MKKLFNFTFNKNFNKKRFLFFSAAFTLGLLISIIIYNSIERKKDHKLEVTFVTPSQAIIFWVTDHPTLGYVQYGDKKNSRSQKADQTSSQPSEIHAVVIDDVPLDGLYLSIHHQSDSKLFWPKPIHITFDPTMIE